jgi:hypothetical protein
MLCMRGIFTHMRVCIVPMHAQASGADLQSIFDRLPILELQLTATHTHSTAHTTHNTLHIYPHQYLLYGGQAAFQITHTGLSDVGVTLFVLGDVFLRAGE